MSNSIPYDINFNSNSIGNAFTFDSSGSTFNGSISGNTNALLKNQNNTCTDQTSILYTKNSDNSIAASVLSLSEDVIGLYYNEQSKTGTRLTSQAIMSCDMNSVLLQYVSDNGTTVSSPSISLSENGIYIYSSSYSTPSQFILSTDGTVLLDTTKTVPTSLTDIGTEGEIRFDDTNGILYRCTTGSTTAGSGKWVSYYSTTAAPIIQGSNTLTSTLELKNSDGSEFVLNGTNFIIEGLNSSSVNLSPELLTLSSTNLDLSITSSNLSYKNSSCNFVISDGITSYTDKSTFSCTESVFSYSISTSSGISNVIQLTDEVFAINMSNSELVFISDEVFSVNCVNGTSAPKFNLEANLSSNIFSVDHYAISNSALNALPTYNLIMQGTTIPILDMYSTQLSSTNVVQSIQNSDGTYSPYITGLKTDPTTGNLGIYSNNYSSTIVLSSNSVTVNGSTNLDSGKITTDGSGTITGTSFVGDVSSATVIPTGSTTSETLANALENVVYNGSKPSFDVTTVKGINGTGGILKVGTAALFDKTVYVDGASTLDNGKITTDGSGNIVANTISCANGIAGRHYGTVNTTSINSVTYDMVPSACVGGSVELDSGNPVILPAYSGSSGTAMTASDNSNTASIPEGSIILLLNSSSSKIAVCYTNTNSSNQELVGYIESDQASLFIQGGSRNWILFPISNNYKSSINTTPNTTYANLPSSPVIGATYLVTNGCKPGETTGNGTGCLCIYDGSNWVNVSTGTTVTI